MFYVNKLNTDTMYLCVRDIHFTSFYWVCNCFDSVVFLLISLCTNIIAIFYFEKGYFENNTENGHA